MKSIPHLVFAPHICPLALLSEQTNLSKACIMPIMVDPSSATATYHISLPDGADWQRACVPLVLLFWTLRDPGEARVYDPDAGLGDNTPCGSGLRRRMNSPVFPTDGLFWNTKSSSDASVKIHPVPEWVAQMVGSLPHTLKAAVSIPCQGRYLDCGFDPWSMFLSHINVSLSFHLLLSLKSFFKCPQVKIKKKKTHLVRASSYAFCKSIVGTGTLLAICSLLTYLSYSPLGMCFPINR